MSASPFRGNNIPVKHDPFKKATSATSLSAPDGSSVQAAANNTGTDAGTMWNRLQCVSPRTAHAPRLPPRSVCSLSHSRAINSRSLSLLLAGR